MDLPILDWAITDMRYKDYDKVIELNPKDANAYFNRGIAYQKLGSDNNMKQDAKIAARLGYKEAQDFLRSEGIEW